MTRPRLLTIMGSGETAPTMKSTHRQIFDRLDRGASAVLLDTPFGFQENAAVLTAKTIEYFRDATGRTVEAAGLTRPQSGDTVAVERGIDRVRRADWLFAGPGSPTYTLQQWRSTPIPEAIGQKLREGGAVVFSSAAALTLGVRTVPVYEIYKVGASPTWLDGLDLLAEIGVRAAVIPHFDNQEGGNHDTRFCYLGERRLALLEDELDADTYVLGVDEHTGVVLDLDADTATVVGKGALTLRRRDGSTTIETGRTVPIDVLRDPRTTPTGPVAPVPDATPGPAGTGAAEHPASLVDTARAREVAFDAAIEARDADGAADAVLRLEADIVEWSTDTLQSDDVDRARQILRSLIVRLADAAGTGLRDPRTVLGPVVDAALAARRIARDERAFAVSDALRDGLVAAGIEIRDTVDGTEWEIT